MILIKDMSKTKAKNNIIFNDNNLEVHKIESEDGYTYNISFTAEDVQVFKNEQESTNKIRFKVNKK